jgi:beta-lactamase superfamily II metal-dependent hydrolase
MNGNDGLTQRRPGRFQAAVRRAARLPARGANGRLCGPNGSSNGLNGWGRGSGRPSGAPVTSAGWIAVVAAFAACSGDTVTPDPDPPGNGDGGVMILRVFDLGENENGGGGDALLITDSTAAGQRHVLIDAGPAGQAGADLDLVARRLEALGVDTLDALVLSHAHTDHFDGMAAVLDRIHVRAFYYNGQVRSFFRYQSLLAQANANAGIRVAVAQPIGFDLGTSAGTSIRILPPLNTWLADANAGSAEINDGSLGTRVTRGTFSLFVAGDGEVAANVRWRTMFADDTRDLTALKVGHHGANDAIFDNGSFGASAWLDHTDPELLLVSANGTSHPRIRALTALLARAVQTFCTPVHGDIVVRVDDAGSNWTVSVQHNAGADCVPGRDATT